MTILESLQNIKQIANDQVEGLQKAPCSSSFCFGGTCHICASRRRATTILQNIDNAIDSLKTLTSTL
jgi:hypothetical protein